MVEAAGVEPAARIIKSISYMVQGNEWGTKGESDEVSKMQDGDDRMDSL